MREVLSVRVDPATARVYEHGWQSWSPTAAYGVGARPHRPSSDRSQLMSYRPEVAAPHDAFWGEGLLAVDPGDGSPVVLVGAVPFADPVPSIRADVRGSRVVVSADGPVDVRTGSCELLPTLAAWADELSAAVGVGELRRPPTAWCTWYQYFTAVTADDVADNLAAMDELDLPVEVVQVDDGYQAEIGDWLVWSPRFGPLPETVDRIRSAGRRAGIWVAPFLVGEHSRVAAEHPDWLVPGASGGHNWGQQLRVLDPTQPGGAAYLHEVFATLRGLGIDYFKIDFLYAGALPQRRHDPHASGVTAYQAGVQIIREAIGEESYLVGCGAPMLPSVGLFDAMRISPDVAPAYEPADGDLARPAQRSAVLTGHWRAWQHGRWWVNDPDCLVARPDIERREEWVAHLARHPGLVSSSDRLRGLDEWGLSATRRLLERGR